MKELIEYLERKIELCIEMNMPLEKFAYTDALKKARALQLQQTGVSGSTYGFTIEFKHVKNKTNVWDNHWNHKIYRTKEIAEEAITQMKKQYEFYRNDYNWRIVELYCH